MKLEYTEENTFQSGILCYIKNIIKFYPGGNSNSFTYNQQPEGLICNNEGINFYFKESRNDTFLEIRFDQFSAKLNDYSIIGRNLGSNTDLMQSFQLLGQNHNSEWIVLSEIREKILYPKTPYHYKINNEEWFNAIRIRNIGECAYITNSIYTFCNTFGAIEVFGTIINGCPSRVFTKITMNDYIHLYIYFLFYTDCNI